MLTRSVSFSAWHRSADRDPFPEDDGPCRFINKESIRLKNQNSEKLTMLNDIR